MERLHIDAQHWAELNRLLDVALDLPPDQRERWLEGLDATYASLKPQLAAFLERAARIETRDFLNTLPKVDERPAHGGDCAGALIGPYRLIKELGAGGMGAVWLAERIDGLLKRPVALKLPHVSTSRAGLAERMAREREILGALAHPNIARLYDAGLTAEGRPYLALEFIEGLRIDAYCLQRNLDVNARLRLFLQVANAVAYAHAKLVIHRDLKPANILVTPEGEVKLLDFGVAKLLDAGEARATQLTELSGRALTLDYAAPEQILGEPLTIAADVYSLGVVLFELLTGERPYHVKRESRAALEEAILTAQMRQPSEAADRAHRKALAGDVDAIVMKALRRAPSDRYDTVNAFADDVVRHLEHRPVLAQPERTWRSVAKFAARHRLAVSLSAVAAFAIVAGAGVATWQMLEAREQRDLAISQQQRALASSEFLALLFEEIGPSGEALTPAALLDRGTQMLDEQYGADERLVAYMLQDVSMRYATLGQVDRQLALLERVAATARRLDDADLLAGASCALSLARVVTDASQARSDYATAAAALRSVAAPSTGTQVSCLRARAGIEQADANRDRAIETLEQALRVIEAAPAATPSSKIAVLSDLSEIHYVNDRSDAALELIDRILQMQNASGRGVSMTKTITLMNRAAILARMGELLTASEVQHEAIRLAGRFGDATLTAAFESHLANTLVRLARCEEALPLLEKSVAGAVQSGNARAAAPAHLLIGHCLIRLGRFDEVEGQLARAEGIWNNNKNTNQRLLNEVALARVELQIRTGKAREAVEAVEAIMRSVGYPQTPRPAGISSILYRAALAHMANGGYERARHLAAESADAAGKMARNVRHSADVGQARLIEARALARLGRTDAARVAVADALEALEYGFGAQHPDTEAARALYERLRESVAPVPAS